MNLSPTQLALLCCVTQRERCVTRSPCVTRRRRSASPFGAFFFTLFCNLIAFINFQHLNSKYKTKTLQKVDKFHLKKTLQNTIQTNFDVRVRHLDYNHKKEGKREESKYKLILALITFVIIKFVERLMKTSVSTTLIRF